MTFATELAAALGSQTDSNDIRVSTRRLYFYDFDGHPIRIWDGMGRLTTTTSVGAALTSIHGRVEANEWMGTIDANGVNHHQVPAIQDSRDGTSPRYRFSIPYLDKATYDSLKADQALAQGRDLLIYRVLVKHGEGLIPSTTIGFYRKLTMQGVEFMETPEGEPGNMTFRRSAAVLARSEEFGRSKLPYGTMTDTSQRERARLLGVTSDSGCSFVAGNAFRTYIIGD